MTDMWTQTSEHIRQSYNNNRYRWKCIKNTAFKWNSIQFQSWFGCIASKTIIIVPSLRLTQMAHALDGKVIN